MKANPTTAANLAAPVVLRPREQLRQLRAKIAATAQSLIDILDWIDGDPDLEDGGDYEPSLGALNDNQSRNQTHWFGGGRGSDLGVTDELEEASEDEGAQCDDEGEDSDNGDCGRAPFTMDQVGARWAYGEAQGAR